jgi:predicted Zn finger-like uncharacterized protein
MRLTCPNCSARYEVADSMIPPEGRDVQCSNCSTTWFQPGRRTDRQMAVGVTPTAAEGVRPPVEAAEMAHGPDDAIGATPATPMTDAAPPVENADVGEPTAPAAELPSPEEPTEPTLRRREIDPDVRDILREEAEREARLRRAEAAPVETQSEMPLEEEPDDTHRARRRAELEAAEDAFSVAAGAPAARDLFPDIDEINSTLRDTGDRSTAEADASDIDTLDAAPRRRRGTRIGFLLAIVLAAAAAVVYVNADLIAGQVPGLAPALEGYVDAVNSARFWLDDLAQGLGGETDGG